MRVHTDQGTCFEGEVFKEFCRRLHIHKSRTTAFHPQCNGAVERLNRTLMEMLKRKAGHAPNTWDHHLSTIVAAYNRTPHSSTSLTPYKLMYGQEARLPVEAEFGVPAPQVRTNHLVDWMLKGAHDANAIARRVTNRVQLRNKDAYDAGVVDRKSVV